jgi:hypothetical protein
MVDSTLSDYHPSADRLNYGVKYHSFPLQSEKEDNTVLPTISEEEGTSQQENVQFSDDVAGDTLKFNPITDTSFYDDYIPNADLSNFLARPVEINSFSWSQSDSSVIKTTIKPWQLFLNNTIIKKKIDNFAFISCNLHVKVVINASPFLYGKMIAAYHPMASHLNNSIGHKSDAPALIPFSQRPNISIIPSCNKGGEMVLPFFYWKNWLEVTNSSEIGSMGSIDYVLYSALQSANGATGNSVQVTTYAWAEDVRLCGPTIKLAMQSEIEKSKKDEYGKGVVSAPASAIAAAAGMLEDIPIISPFATATRIGAEAVSSIASIFGFTNVPVISDVAPYKNLSFHSLASTQIGEPVEKLTLDPKNELTIDPAIAGLTANDELNISSIVQRDSYLAQFPWNNTQTKDTQLFNTTILPLMNSYATSGNTYCQSSPMGHLQFMFWNWRGDIIYTFKFIKSPYHRGRVRISWDPVGDIVSTSDNTTAVFNQIVDISTTDEIEVRIPYMQALPWLRTKQSQPERSGRYNWWQTSSFAYEHDRNYSNGTLTLRVLNELTAPVTSSSIDVMVHVRAAENFEFANPTDFLDTRSVFPTQSEVESNKLTAVAGREGTCDKNRYLVNFGEAVVSLRTLLRRSTLAYVQTQALSTTAPYTIVHAAQSRIPPSWGFDPNGFNTANKIIGASTAPFNFVNRTPYNWLEFMFVGRRGSMIWHYNVDVGVSNSHSVRLERLITPITSANLDNVIVQDFAGSTDQEMRFFTTFSDGLPRYGSGLGGVALTDQNSQAGLSALLPMYNNFRFEISDPFKTIYGNTYDNSDTEMFDLTTCVRKQPELSANHSVVTFKYCSIGTDFNFLFFLNVPTMYVHGDPSTT